MIIDGKKHFVIRIGVGCFLAMRQLAAEHTMLEDVLNVIGNMLDIDFHFVGDRLYRVRSPNWKGHATQCGEWRITLFPTNRSTSEEAIETTWRIATALLDSKLTTAIDHEPVIMP